MPLQVALEARRLDTVLAGLHLEVAAATGLTPHEVLAMEHLGMDGALGPTELGQRLKITTGAVTALLDRLEERGFVQREAHPHDRRRLLVRLTPAGSDALMVHLRPMVGEVVALVRAMPPEERAAVARFLSDMSALIQRYPEK